MARDDDQRVVDKLLEVILMKAQAGEVTASDLAQLIQATWLRSIAVELSLINNTLDGIRTRLP